METKQKWVIVPDTQENYDELDPKRIAYTYLHGQLQTDCGYDCFGLINCELPINDRDTYIDDSVLEDGAYPCTYNGKDCTLYFWHCKHNRSHGLTVYNTDTEAKEYAEKALTEKRTRI